MGHPVHLSVADNYGVLAYAVFLFVLTIWFSRQWGEATACPYLQLEDLVAGTMGPKEAVVRTVAATAGGLAVFRYSFRSDRMRRTHASAQTLKPSQELMAMHGSVATLIFLMGGSCGALLSTFIK